jgi:enterochelin esterase-like enzyme
VVVDGRRLTRGRLATLLALMLVAACAAPAGRPAATATPSAPLVAGRARPVPTPTEPPWTAPARTEERVFASPALGREAPYTAFVPPGYDEAGGRYPVLYMLHGMGGRRAEWQEFGLFGAAEALMAAGEIDPFLIVLPQGDQGYWLDQYDGPKWGTHVAADLVREVDARYRTLPERTARAVGGMSMGALGALQLGINHAGVFGVVGAHTPTWRDYEATHAWFGAEMATVFFGDRAYFDRHDPVYLYHTHADAAQRLILRLDVGADDPWRRSVEWFRRRLEERGVAHEWRLLDGAGHGDTDHGYWSRHTADYVRFYGRAFGQAARIDGVG